jgi:hypothetical protein
MLRAFAGAGAAFVVVAVPAARQQQRRSPIDRHPPTGVRADWARVAIVAVTLGVLIAANVTTAVALRGLQHRAPVMGLALWAALLATSAWRRPDWRAAGRALKGALFLVTLVILASLMPVTRLPSPSPIVSVGLGVLSSVFDNIPLTALALAQGGHDWPTLAYAVGFGGSMIWFGSSAGVAVTDLFPEARSVVSWLREAWFVPIGYAVGVLVMIALSR